MQVKWKQWELSRGRGGRQRQERPGARWLPWIYCCTAGAVTPPLPVCQQPGPVGSGNRNVLYSFFTLWFLFCGWEVHALPENTWERTTSTAVCPSYPGLLKSAPARLHISRPSRSPLAARLRDTTHTEQLDQMSDSVQQERCFMSLLTYMLIVLGLDKPNYF